MQKYAVNRYERKMKPICDSAFDEKSRKIIFAHFMGYEESVSVCINKYQGSQTKKNTNGSSRRILLTSTSNLKKIPK